MHTQLKVLIFLLSALSLAVALTDAPSTVEEQLAQKNLQIAQLTKQLHESQNEKGVCQAALSAVFAQQEKQDQAAIDAANAAIAKAENRIQEKK